MNDIVAEARRKSQTKYITIRLKVPVGELLRSLAHKHGLTTSEVAARALRSHARAKDSVVGYANHKPTTRGSGKSEVWRLCMPIGLLEAVPPPARSGAIQRYLEDNQDVPAPPELSELNRQLAELEREHERVRMLIGQLAGSLVEDSLREADDK